MSSIYGIVNKLNLTAYEKMKSFSTEMFRWKPDNAGIYLSPSHIGYVNAMPVSKPQALNSKGIDADNAINSLFNKEANSTVGMGCAMVWNTPESLTEFLPYFDNQTSLCITADARIDNREELAALLGYNWVEVESNTDSWFILKAFIHWGTDCTKHLIGDFAFAIWNEKEQEFFMARDIYGVRPLYYTHNNSFFAFSSNLRGLLALDIDRTHDEQWLIDIKAGLHSEAWRSLYKHISKLEPSHYLTYKNNSISTTRYFEFDLHKEITVADENSVHNEVKRLTEQAIRSRMRSIYPLGSEMSSGLDSSVIATLGHKLKRNEQAFIQFSHVLPEWSEYKTKYNIDEQRGIEEICNYACIPHPVWITAEDKGYIEAFENFYEKVGEISTTTFPVLSDSLIEKSATLNVRTILSGFGGDECVSHSGAGYFPELLLHNQWKRFFVDMRKACIRNEQVYWRKAGYEILRTKASPLFTLINKTVLQPRKLKGKIAEMSFEKDFLNTYNLASRIVARSPETNYATIRERQVKRLSHAYIQYRYEYSNLLSETSHIAYSYPLTDKRLVEYVLSLPYTLKYGTNGRYLMRTLAQGLLPEKYVVGKKIGWAVSNGIERAFVDNLLKISTNKFTIERIAHNTIKLKKHG